jgi:hypothetical protein
MRDAHTILSLEGVSVIVVLIEGFVRP